MNPVQGRFREVKFATHVPPWQVRAPGQQITPRSWAPASGLPGRRCDSTGTGYLRSDHPCRQMQRSMLFLNIYEQVLRHTIAQTSVALFLPRRLDGHQAHRSG